MFKTTLQDMLGIEFPFIGGTMMDISRAPFVAAIAEAGALGLIASAIYLDEASFRDDLRAVKAKTKKPFGVNINLFPMMRKLDNLRYLDIMAEEGVRIVETSGHYPPDDLVERIKKHRMTWIHKCVGVRYAKRAERVGADAVTVVGFENGGATGILNVTTLVLTPTVVDALKVPVIAGGGVVDGRTLLAVLSLGAAGAIVGTRILLSEECPVHPELKQALCAPTSCRPTSSCGPSASRTACGSTSPRRRWWRSRPGAPGARSPRSTRTSRARRRGACTRPATSAPARSPCRRRWASSRR